MLQHIDDQQTDKGGYDADYSFYGQFFFKSYSLYPINQMTFRDCSNVLLKNITVESSPGESCAIYPRCKDFTFKRFAIRLPAGSKRIYASNADGIHITGLGGKLTVEDCVFENLGDDALNVHTTGGVVTLAFQGTKITVNARLDGTAQWYIDDVPAEPVVMLQCHLPDRTIRIQAIADAYERICREMDRVYLTDTHMWDVAVCADKVHPSEDGYNRIAEKMADILKKLVER